MDEDKPVIDDSHSFIEVMLVDALDDVPTWLRVCVWPFVLIILLLYAWLGCKPDDGRHT